MAARSAWACLCVLVALLPGPAARAQDSTAVRALAAHATTFDLVQGNGRCGRRFKTEDSRV